jgi:hypothetical protein
MEGVAFFGADDAVFFGAGAGLAGAFFSAVRAEAACPGFVRPGVDGFDFAAIFFDVARALAMSCNDPVGF